MTEERTDLAPQRRRFVAALAVFLLWVAALGITAVTTGHKPLPKPPALEGR